MLIRLLFVVFVALLPLFVSSCGHPEERLCEAKCDCEGCSPSRFDACLRDRDDLLDDADRRRCMPEYDDYVACQRSTWWCSGRDWKTDCGRERNRLYDCID